jgi:hypothetical protein
VVAILEEEEVSVTRSRRPLDQLALGWPSGADGVADGQPGCSDKDHDPEPVRMVGQVRPDGEAMVTACSSRLLLRTGHTWREKP